MSRQLTRAEAWQALHRAHTGIFTTLRRDGTPISLPVWFVALDERIYVASPARRSKVTRIERNRRVAFLIESGERFADLMGVHITGDASVIDDAARIAEVRAAIDEKYDSFRSRPRSVEDRHAQEIEVAVIEIVPDERMLSWDNSLVSLPR